MSLTQVSVLFNEPKLLKFNDAPESAARRLSFSALQRAEIAEMRNERVLKRLRRVFQCSSTSRNC